MENESKQQRLQKDAIAAMTNVPYEDLNDTFKAFSEKEQLGEEERYALWRFIVQGDTSCRKERKSIQEQLDHHEKLLNQILEALGKK